MRLLQFGVRVRGLSKRLFHIQAASGNGSKMSLRRGLMSPELKMFLQMLKSPSHIMFVASNVALLVHLLFFSTVRRKQKTEEFLSQMEELENYVDLINDLDNQNAEIQKRIRVLKALQQKDSSTPEVQHMHQNDQDTTPQPFTPREEIVPLRLHSTHAERFLKHRNLIATTFSKRSNIAKLFENSNRPSIEEEKDIIADERSYSAPILNTLLALSHLLVKTFVIELNLKHALGDDETQKLISSDSFLLHEDLFAFMKHDREKEELLAKLQALKSDSGNTEPRPLWSSLDKGMVSKLSDQFAEAEEFKCKNNRRYDNYHHLSGRWLNYDHSDTFTSIQASASPKFGSSIVNSEEYLQSFDTIFSAYEDSKAPLRNFTLLLQLAKALLRGGECVPSYSIFEFLLDKLGKCGLYNYQSLVYDVLPSFDYRQTAFADSARQEDFASRDAIHFEHMIEENPEILGTLIEYQASRKDFEAFELLLNYFEPTVTSGQKLLEILPSFATRRYSRSSTLLDCEEEICIDLHTMGRAFRSCVEMKNVTAIDKILCKLFLNSVQTDKGVRVVLNKVKDDKSLLCMRTSSSELPSLLFTEDILTLLAQAYSELKDQTRARWLLPHLDSFLKSNNSRQLMDATRRIASIANLKPATMDRVQATLPRRSQSINLRSTDRFNNEQLPSISAVV